MASTNDIPRIFVTAVTGETTPLPATSNFWPSFKQQVEHDELNLGSHALQCVLCMGLMPSGPDQVQGQHRPWILPCGHILGSSCMSELARRKSFFDEDMDLACPACHVRLPRHGCGHQAIGMYAPLDKDSFSCVPLILSEGGLAATNCGLCEGKMALEQLNAVAALDPPNLQRGKQMNLRIRADSWRDIICKDNGYNAVYRYDHEAWYQKQMEYKDIPETVRELWEAYVKAWSEQVKQLWFLLDPSLFRLCASVGEKPEGESVGFFERIMG